MLIEIEYTLNTFKNALIVITLFEVLYNVKSKKFLVNLVADNNSIFADFIKIRETIRNDIFDAIKLAQIKIIVRYNSKYKISDLVDNVYLRLAKIEDVEYYIFKLFFLFTKKVDSYKILEKINNLFYKLELLLSISRVHLVILVIYLEQVKSNLFY